ncbi:hypothetical protein [Pseudoalteromonas sp. Of7M-16]|uniref:hypothetical protein n=1 Tax=Pseudoalteromonas sp. Of7M-16 TaxID=2917756 RepID=UPI001EF7330F|nr:hypothetical protein [Pseudoalteromonas sp. Of7M-16]MCG7551597.1 hypothetical protein [Pseudoalteromonas sp. Of7M-16]
MAHPSSPRPKKGSPPRSSEDSGVVGNNTEKPASSELVPMNFKVESEFKRDFKTFAVGHDMTMVDVLRAAFELYKRQKGVQ